ncbi:MAG: ABC transporter substrate-binding protein [Paracoccus sp. (in: a-proteobacteria)]|uniref:ABC transporter substrate-binding protein n=1 Tax=Paracoccus sp. TaxID=267 RepID=UPI0039E44DAE
MRRKIPLPLASLVFASATFIAAGSAPAEDLVIMISGGTFADSQIEAFVKPFEAETGLKVTAIKSEVPAAKHKLAVESSTVDFDLALKTEADGIMLDKLGYLIPIDYSAFDPEELSGIPEGLRPAWGVGDVTASFVLSYDSTAEKKPRNYADFWNVAEFPGKRTLQSFIGTQGPLEEALLADGVPMDQLYPLDVDRAFAKLDEIKPEIRKWWGNGNEVLQLFNTNVANMGMNFDGRVHALQSEGRTTDLTFNQAKYYGVYWTVPKGAPRPENAMKFLAFATKAAQQAKMAEISGFAPTNTKAVALLPDETARKLVTHPDNIKNAYQLNGQWYAEVGEDGLSNAERVQQRWNVWITQ